MDEISRKEDTAQGSRREHGCADSQEGVYGSIRAVSFNVPATKEVPSTLNRVRRVYRTELRSE